MKININKKEFEINCNAYTRILYKKVFNRGIFEDIKAIQMLSVKQAEARNKAKIEELDEEETANLVNEVTFDYADDYIDAVERIAYILIYTANPKMESFEEWLSSFKKIDLTDDWIREVTELAVDSFC